MLSLIVISLFFALQKYYKIGNKVHLLPIFVRNSMNVMHIGRRVEVVHDLNIVICMI